MEIPALSELGPEQFTELLPIFLGNAIDEPLVAQQAQRRVEAVVREWSAEIATEVLSALGTVGQEIRVYPPHPEARRISREWCRAALPAVEVEGAEHLRAARLQGPTFLLCNHLSYFDSTAIDAALDQAGHSDLADNVVSLAGPKVYSDLFRRFAAVCLATVPVPQSTQLAHTAQLSPRELARRALQAISAATQAASEGRSILIYGEGSRSRTGTLQPFIPGVGRYLRPKGSIVVPVALSGTSQIMPVGQTRVTPGSVTLRLGEPLTVAEQGGPKRCLEIANDRIAYLLPPELRPT